MKETIITAMIILSMLLSSLAQTNKLTHPFSVSPSQTVLFSPGNIIMDKSTGEMYFAKNQASRIGNANVNTLYSKSGLNDLFRGVPQEGHKQVFAPLGMGWRVLNAEEWNYLLNERNTKSGARYVKVYVSNILGMLIFPDDFECPSNVNFNVDNINTECPDVIQRLGSEWNTIENLGVVFLPAAGWIQIGDMGEGAYFHKGRDEHEFGYYWINDGYLFEFSAYDQSVTGRSLSRQYLFCYRLVKNHSTDPLSKKSSDYHSWGKGLSTNLKPAEFSNNKFEGTYVFYIDEDKISFILETNRKLIIAVNGERKNADGKWSSIHENGYRVYLHSINCISFYDDNNERVPMVHMYFRDGYVDIKCDKKIYSFKLYKVE